MNYNEWYHIAWTFSNSGEIKAYINGENVRTGNFPGNITLNTEDIILAAHQDPQPYLGLIDELRIWNVVRTESDIRENIHLPLAGTETGLVSCWQFNEGSGTEANDIITNNDGTLTNMDDTDWINSTIPFGAGSVNTQIVSTTGVVDFTGTGISMDITSKTGTDSLVVNKIELAPNVEPSGVDSTFNSQYWIIHKYGSGTITADISMTIAEDLTSEDESNPTKIKLYTRETTSDSSWTYNLTAGTVDAATNTVTFSGITDFSQLIITSDNLSIPQNIVTEIIGTDVQLSWDAVDGATSYKVYSSDDPYGTFTEDTGGTPVGETWTIAYTESKKFYYVIAVTEAKMPVTKKIKVKDSESSSE